ncbi:MAG: hypothetical protein CL878_02305 [Dehalococcoidia bacterium]|nr:hypothetical protein [Dehalococcoidia bacterium]
MTKRLKWITHADLAIERNPTVGREEYLDHMTFQRNERPLFTEIFGPIVGLKEEWEQEGAAPAELDFSAFEYCCESRGRIPVNTGRMGGLKPEVLEETDTHILSRDELGRTMKLIKGVATLPLPLDYPVKNMDDWRRIKPCYEFSEARFGRDWERIAGEHLRAGRVVCASIPGGFDEPRQLLGEEALCLAYYEDPELVHEILDTVGKTAFEVLGRVSSAVQVDLLSVHEDMAGQSGPLAGPRQVDEFIKPYYRRIWDMLADRGTRLFDQDSDGDMNGVIPSFLDAGVNCMHPMEPAANMDIVEIRRQYGDRLAFYGGIDKHVLRRDRREIAAELEYKIPPMVASGGCVLALDHRIPNGTPLANYRFYMQKVWELIGRAK